MSSARVVFGETEVQRIVSFRTVRPFVPIALAAVPHGSAPSLLVQLEHQLAELRSLPSDLLLWKPALEPEREIKVYDWILKRIDIV